MFHRADTHGNTHGILHTTASGPFPHLRRKSLKVRLHPTSPPSRGYVLLTLEAFGYLGILVSFFSFSRSAENILEGAHTSDPVPCNVKSNSLSFVTNDGDKNLNPALGPGRWVCSLCWR